MAYYCPGCGEPVKNSARFCPNCGKQLVDDLDDIDEDELTAESYRTTIEEDPDDLSLDAADLSDDDY